MRQRIFKRYREESMSKLRLIVNVPKESVIRVRAHRSPATGIGLTSGYMDFKSPEELREEPLDLRSDSGTQPLRDINRPDASPRMACARGTHPLMTAVLLKQSNLHRGAVRPPCAEHSDFLLHKSNDHAA